MNLDELQAAAAAMASESPPEDLEPRLRDERVALVRQCLGLSAEDAARLYAGELGERHRALTYSALRSLPREDDREEALAARVKASLAPAPGNPGGLLAAMLLFQPFELPSLPALDEIPGWLLVDYARFRVTSPRVLNQVGDVERYFDYLARTVGMFHSFIAGRAHSAAREAAGDVFVDFAQFVHTYFTEHNLKPLFRQRAQIMESWLAGKGAPMAHLSPPRPPAGGRPLRIGVLAFHFEPQTETYFTLAHIERLARERCELVLYSFRPPVAPLAKYAASLATSYAVLPEDNIAGAAQDIRDDELDCLLISTNVTVGASALTVLSLFRLAPVQVISGSSPVSSGLTSADWFVSAEYNDTRERAAEQFTEQVYLMPGMLTRYAYHHDSDPRTLTMQRADLGIPEGEPVYFSGANYFKIIPELSALWARLLAEQPDAWLLLMPFNPNWSDSYLSRPFSARVLGQIAEAGADVSRVILMNPVPTRADVQEVIRLCDVYLDSYPFAGACSLLDPLLAGVPVVARTGKTFRGAVGAAMLRGLGLQDMAVEDEQAYLERARRLVDPGMRARERARIEAALHPVNPVFDSGTASRHLEAAILDMVSRSEAADAALLRESPEALRGAIERLAHALAERSNPWFASVTDRELVRLVLLPYFRSLPDRGVARHMMDVGACVGEMSRPFLSLGWSADLFEPDPACQEALAALAAEYPERILVHRLAVSDAASGETTFYRSSVGLSGLSPSPYGAVQDTLRVPSTRLDAFARARGLARLDLLKIDAEGWDFAALRSHDFAALPPQAVMVEFGTMFASQTLEAVQEAIGEMRGNGYEALVFSYDDDGNFEQQVWRYRLIGATFGAPVARPDGHAMGNILFFRRGDVTFLATVLRLLRGFLPPDERAPFLSP